MKVVEALVTSTAGPDIGSTYLVLECERCNEHLGKIYKTTPRDLDDIREAFTLSVDKCNW